MEYREEIFGKSHKGHPVVLRTYGKGMLGVLLLGGVHGDESEGYLFAERMLKELDEDILILPSGISLSICARVNPDGCEADRRTNQRNVDLNRNLPTKDWTGEFNNPRYFPGSSAGSENESLAQIRMIEELDPSLIISLHSYEHAMINYNGDCEDLARAMSQKNSLPPKSDIGYPTPGSLGTYTGWEKNIPTITLEILRGQDPDDAYRQNISAVMTAITYYRGRPLPERTAVAKK